ncbi:uncharacterized protein M421DRAFT_95278 [Didymella exigua CBS 183.55]|uniref:Uncharacterized protein n=1 Tax=Didymella exigua CBS 183.55 TaxID=1150837 RepID=A0A6A5R936_9PLEO|nr:uncharacterized protein M421DRAFT_95278 [Didymella exigua CBS 183.55]KAF1924741.1 hypothetical protein M421DRAFT_95278 [Didymella exigua CBS 183.55]
MYFNFTLRKRYFTFWHYCRIPSYTQTTRQQMAADRKAYLDHLARWLDYEEESSTPPPVVDGTALPPKKPNQPKPRKRVDSFVDEARREIARDVAKRNQMNGATLLKYDADLATVSRMEIVAPLPSYARDDEDEGFADGPSEEPGLMRTMSQKVKDFLGIPIAS